MGELAEGKMTAHQAKKLDVEDLKTFRDRFNIPISDADIDKVPYYRPAEDSEELRYMRARREALGGFLPVRIADAPALKAPPLESFKTQLEGTGERAISTTMALVRILTTLVRDKNIGKHVVPIVPDEARTFGMEGMFRQIGIYSSMGQLYTPVDREQLMYYREDKEGPDPAGRHQRGRRLVFLDRRGHGLRKPRRADDSVLHLLLDVWISARWRFHLGRR